MRACAGFCPASAWVQFTAILIFADRGEIRRIECSGKAMRFDGNVARHESMHSALAAGRIEDIECCFEAPPLPEGNANEISILGRAWFYEGFAGNAPPNRQKEKIYEFTRRNVAMPDCKLRLIYDPDRGDRKGHIPKGTKFEDLPDDWKCPVCGAGKSHFRRLSDEM